MKLPKLELACSKDELRGNLTYIYFKDDEIIATDAWIVVIHSKLKMFGEELKDLPNGFIKAVDWKKLSGKDITSCEYKNGYIHFNYRKGEILVKYLEEKDAKFKYPNYNSVFPTVYEESLNKVGINSQLLLNAHKAMTENTKDSFIKLSFSGELRAIKLDLIEKKGKFLEITFIKGLIMPISLRQI